MSFGKERLICKFLLTWVYLSPLTSSDFSPYVDVSQVQLRLADSHWCWFWGWCRNNAYEHSAKPVCANSIWMWGTWWIRMAHCGRFQQTHDIWLLPRYPQSQVAKHRHYRYIAKSPATLDERGCPLQMHDVSGKSHWAKVASWHEVWWAHQKSFQGVLLASHNMPQRRCWDKDWISDSDSQMKMYVSISKWVMMKA